MKISASIYSDKKRNLKEVIDDLQAHHVDMLHVDCNDDLGVFNDITQIRQWTNLPIDLHIITSNPEKYYPFLEQYPVEYVTFQLEQLTQKITLPTKIKAKKGIAITTPTPVEAFNDYEHFDFILIMATTPGQSGGVFDRINFKKIRDFKSKYPSKSIHVDGGVNAEVSFILRNMGVTSAVSGSYLFNAASVGQALLNLTNRTIESHYHIKDFMIPITECATVVSSTIDFLTVLLAIDKSKLGFTVVVDDENNFKGIISNADIRKVLIAQYGKWSEMNILESVNKNALTINENATVLDMLQKIKKANFPVMYLPVINNEQKATGIITFVNLVKGEL